MAGGNDEARIWERLDVISCQLARVEQVGIDTRDEVGRLREVLHGNGNAPVSVLSRLTRMEGRVEDVRALEGVVYEPGQNTGGLPGRLKVAEKRMDGFEDACEECRAGRRRWVDRLWPVMGPLVVLGLGLGFVEWVRGRL